jgi:hypothetical protein
VAELRIGHDADVLRSVRKAAKHPLPQLGALLVKPVAGGEELLGVQEAAQTQVGSVALELVAVTFLRSSPRGDHGVLVYSGARKLNGDGVRQRAGTRRRTAPVTCVRVFSPGVRSRPG